ncbi:hypothetical protein KIH39_05920 [Telmatocola sphagniphila]|uniref:Uncharacterized protein n=1 Tax=Telmatocola sphagniphila TaxID=1123043 RepID=A0A8E6B7S3_9BACT|nr:hypothetical protein [Telmatocola sphagniphila]QVL33448.1 hypothetical protein KIH39_05920 [Telmatocola sphagniphila]
MKRILFSLACLMGLAGVSSAQAPMMPGSQPYPPGYGQMPQNPAGYGQMPQMGGVMPANFQGGYGPQMNPYAAPVAASAPGGGDSGRFGFNPIFKRMFHLKDSGCANGKCANGAGKGPGNAASTGGTLVFPNQQFIRSPRDFFMEN